MPVDESSSSEYNYSEYLFVLLGASNLARGYSALTRHFSKSIAPTPVKFINALGPGRGYCAWGGLFNFKYSPISECRVLASVSARQGQRLAMLITDIGNDIMYGVPAQSLIDSLDTLIEKSLTLNAEVFMTSIHVDVAQDLRKTSFKLLKLIFYPKSPVTFEQADSAVKQVNRYLEEKSQKNQHIHLVGGLGAFCGLDKIHYSLLKSNLAWSCIANEMLSVLKVTPLGNIGLASTAISLCKNLNRLITSDMLRMTKKPKGFF